MIGRWIMNLFRLSEVAYLPHTGYPHRTRRFRATEVSNSERSRYATTIYDAMGGK